MTARFLFFPFTHISERQFKTILSFFPSFEYFSMTADPGLSPDFAKWHEQGKISPVFLSQETVLAVDQNHKQYLAWAGIHKGNRMNLKSLLQDAPYFTHETDVTAIKSNLRRGTGAKGKQGSDIPSESNQMTDLLFLKMAQLYDEQNEGIDLALNDLDTIHDNLISHLRGMAPASHQIKKAGKDGGSVMTRERIGAWSRCMTALGDLNSKADNPLFITTSDAVFDYLESNCKDVINALDIDHIKVHENECGYKNQWHHDFYEVIMGAVAKDGCRKRELPGKDDACCLSGHIKLNHFSGNDINRIFNFQGKQISVCLVKLK